MSSEFDIIIPELEAFSKVKNFEQNQKRLRNDFKKVPGGYDQHDLPAGISQCRVPPPARGV